MRENKAADGGGEEGGCREAPVLRQSLFPRCFLSPLLFLQTLPAEIVFYRSHSDSYGCCFALHSNQAASCSHDANAVCEKYKEGRIKKLYIWTLKLHKNVVISLVLLYNLNKCN